MLWQQYSRILPGELGKRGVREAIIRYFSSLDFVEGEDFVLGV
jgi:hypothetical protein